MVISEERKGNRVSEGPDTMVNVSVPNLNICLMLFLKNRCKFYIFLRPSLVTHVCNPITRKAKQDAYVCHQLGLHCETLCKN